MLEQYLIGHCAPTLANIKTANLFGYRFASQAELERQMEEIRQILSPKGVSVRILHERGGRALIYVYRRQRLLCDLEADEVRSFLGGYGYDDFSEEPVLDTLAGRIQNAGGEFPHEIGLFLGYPLGDVKGFIKHKGQNCKCVGCWKVYCDECEAQRQFCRFEKCRSIYCRLYREGRGLSRLIVAA